MSRYTTPITWRNVTAPDLSSTARTITQAGNSLGRSISGIGDEIQDYSDNRSKRETDEFIADLNSMGSDEERQAAIQLAKQTATGAFLNYGDATEAARSAEIHDNSRTRMEHAIQRHANAQETHANNMERFSNEQEMHPYKLAEAESKQFRNEVDDKYYEGNADLSRKTKEENYTSAKIRNAGNRILNADRSLDLNTKQNTAAEKKLVDTILQDTSGMTGDELVAYMNNNVRAISSLSEAQYSRLGDVFNNVSSAESVPALTNSGELQQYASGADPVTGKPVFDSDSIARMRSHAASVIKQNSVLARNNPAYLNSQVDRYLQQDPQYPSYVSRAGVTDQVKANSNANLVEAATSVDAAAKKDEALTNIIGNSTSELHKGFSMITDAYVEHNKSTFDRLAENDEGISKSQISSSIQKIFDVVFSSSNPRYENLTIGEKLLAVKRYAIDKVRMDSSGMKTELADSVNEINDYGSYGINSESDLIQEFNKHFDQLDSGKVAYDESVKDKSKLDEIAARSQRMEDIRGQLQRLSFTVGSPTATDHSRRATLTQELMKLDKEINNIRKTLSPNSNTNQDGN